ncbi:MutS-related protein [Spirillospora sp. CA-255316]
MRPHLLFRADGMPAGGVRSGEPQQALPDEVIDDLRLEHLWTAMARGDERLFAVARSVTSAPLTDPSAIAHRQEVLDDCLRNASSVRALYELAGEAVSAEEKIFWTGAAGRPQGLLNRSLRLLELFCDHLRRLRAFAARQEQGQGFRSAGFTRLFASIRAETAEDYLRTAETLIEQLGFEHGIIVSARLGPGNMSTGFRLHEPPGKGRSPSTRRFRKSSLIYTVPAEHEDSWRAMAAFRDLILADVAGATAESAMHVRDFFRALRDELGFYVGCLNLAEALSGAGLPICVPEPQAPANAALSARGLYEPCLALSLGGAVVDNDLDADGAGLIMVTGTNRGGKTTFLRSVGLAQLMMQSGMIVGARRFAASPADGVFTHFKREEDRSMEHGKLEEELVRMSAVVDRLRPGALVLCNESFVSTNEREGSAIAAEILRGFADVGVRVVFVTHLYALADRLHTDPPVRSLFLTTGRDAEGEPTFRLAPGAPSRSAHAMDLYARVFGEPARPQPPREG